MSEVRHGTLTANTVASVNISRTQPVQTAPSPMGGTDRYVDESFAQVEIVNLSTTPIYFNFAYYENGSVAASPVAPTIKGDNVRIVLPSGALAVPVESQNIVTANRVRTYTVTLRLIAAASADFAITVD